MPSADLLIAFFLATAVFAYMPGPAVLHAAARTLAEGRRAGMMASLDTHLGGYVQVLAAALGLSALCHAVPTLWAVVKLAGAGYLVRLGIGSIRRKPERETALPQVDGRSARWTFVQSVAVEVLDPKTAVFFIAFRPQSVDAGAAWPIWAQLLTSGMIVNVMVSAADLVGMALAGAVSERLRARGASGAWPKPQAAPCWSGSGPTWPCGARHDDRRGKRGMTGLVLFALAFGRPPQRPGPRSRPSSHARRPTARAARARAWSPASSWVRSPRRRWPRWSRRWVRCSWS